MYIYYTYISEEKKISFWHRPHAWRNTTTTERRFSCVNSRILCVFVLIYIPLDFCFWLTDEQVEFFIRSNHFRNIFWDIAKFCTMTFQIPSVIDASYRICCGYYKLQLSKYHNLEGHILDADLQTTQLLYLYWRYVIAHLSDAHIIPNIKCDIFIHPPPSYWWKKNRIELRFWVQNVSTLLRLQKFYMNTLVVLIVFSIVFCRSQSIHSPCTFLGNKIIPNLSEPSTNCTLTDAF